MLQRKYTRRIFLLDFYPVPDKSDVKVAKTQYMYPVCDKSDVKVVKTQPQMQQFCAQHGLVSVMS